MRDIDAILQRHAQLTKNWTPQESRQIVVTVEESLNPFRCKYFVQGPWPKYTSFDARLIQKLPPAPPFASAWKVRFDLWELLSEKVIRPSNGYATYKLGDLQDGFYPAELIECNIAINTLSGGNDGP